MGNADPGCLNAPIGQPDFDKTQCPILTIDIGWWLGHPKWGWKQMILANTRNTLTTSKIPELGQKKIHPVPYILNTSPLGDSAPIVWCFHMVNLIIDLIFPMWSWWLEPIQSLQAGGWSWASGQHCLVLLQQRKRPHLIWTKAEQKLFWGCSYFGWWSSPFIYTRLI